MAPMIGLALGSGAARGWSHIGVIEELEKAGIRPDIVTGCSMGALVGAAYVTGRLEALAEWATKLEWTGIVGMLDVSFAGGGAIAGENVERLMDRLGITGDIDAFDRPFAAVATNYHTGAEEWLTTGPVGKAIRASISLPGVFAPARIGDDWFVDGGLVNPVPVSTCRALGARFIIAVNLNGELIGRYPVRQPARKSTEIRDAIVKQATTSLPPGIGQGIARAAGDLLKPSEPRPGYFDVLATSINIMQDRITRARLAGEPPDAMIVPRLGEMGAFDFDWAKSAIEEGRLATRAALPEIRRYLGEGDGAGFREPDSGVNPAGGSA
ncbi:MAG: patatin-like phospholipase family protein [Brucellaceae bacterium]|nr:patatin-like phospholipase family protein [Brucellaceae bacterium]